MLIKLFHKMFTDKNHTHIIQLTSNDHTFYTMHTLFIHSVHTLCSYILFICLYHIIFTHFSPHKHTKWQRTKAQNNAQNNTQNNAPIHYHNTNSSQVKVTYKSLFFLHFGTPQMDKNCRTVGKQNTWHRKVCPLV